MGNNKYRYSFNRFRLINGVTDEEINKVLEDVKQKRYVDTEYEVSTLLDKIITPDDFEAFFEDVQKWLANYDVQLTEEQLNKVNNHIQEYTEKYKSYQMKYRNIIEEKQKNCQHTDTYEYMYANYICKQCGKKF